MKEDKNELIRIVENAEEFFVIAKENDDYHLLHSELTDPVRWLEVIDHFTKKVKLKIIKQMPDGIAKTELLNNNKFNLN